MTDFTARCLVEAFAVNARIEGMKVENQQRMSIDNTINYGAEAFFVAEGELEDIARRIARGE